MRATILCGSADENGFTRKMCNSAVQYLNSKGYLISFFELGDLEINHCRDCDGCKTESCIIRDDMDHIYNSFSQSNLLILSTPIHFSGPSSLLKTAMDRFQPYWNDKTLSHPSKCIGLLCGGSEVPNFELTEKIFKAFCITTGMDYLGSVKIPDTDNRSTDVVDEVQSVLSGLI